VGIFGVGRAYGALGRHLSNQKA